MVYGTLATVVSALVYEVIVDRHTLADVVSTLLRSVLGEIPA
jgi:hypothetical protein